MSAEIEKMLAHIYNKFENTSMSKKSKLEINTQALTFLYDKVINPTMKAHLSVAEKHGFKVQATKTVRASKAKFVYKMFVNPNGTFIEITFNASLITPRIIITAQSSCKGVGKNYKGKEYAFNEITKQVIEDNMAHILQEVVVM